MHLTFAAPPALRFGLRASEPRGSLTRRCPRACADAPAVAVVEIGSGADLHGQDANVAAVRACRDAIAFNSLPGLARLLPGGDFGKLQVRVTLGVPGEFMDSIDTAKVKEQFPYGSVSVSVVQGGLCIGSGVVLSEQGDMPGDDRIVVINAAVEVLC